MSTRLSRRFRHRKASFLTTEHLESRVLLAADSSVVINELHTNPDVDTELVEFIELHNTSGSDVALGGWYFDDGISYSFPEDAVLPAGGYHVITQNAEHFATKFGREANGQWEGRLSNDGETVVLRSADGDLVDRVDFGLGFPWPTVGGEPGYSMELVNPQFDNQLGGNWRSSTGNQTIFTAGNSWEYFKGTTEPSADPSAWRQTDFDDTNWQTGSTPIGFSRSVVVATELDDMRRAYSTVYLRKDFTIDNAASVESLTLETVFDDGINVWINGTHVAGRNVDSAEIAHDGVANGRGNTRSFESIVLENSSEYLVDGTNTIAVQLLNETLSGSDAYFDAALINNSLRAPGPTPGFANSIAADRLGPSLRQVDHSPTQPSSSEDVTIQIKATDPDGVASVTLEYQTVSPGDYIRISDGRFVTDWTSISMQDDGTNGDAVAGDSIYTAVIPADAHQHRHLMRYRVRADDGAGDAVVVPNQDDPQPNFAYFVYDGIPGWTGADEPGSTDPVSFSADVMNQLPTYHLIADADDVRRSQYQSAFEEVRFRGTMVYGDQVYDHIEFRVRGEFSTYVAGKNKWKFFFNRGHEFQGT